MAVVLVTAVVAGMVGMRWVVEEEEEDEKEEEGRRCGREKDTFPTSSLLVLRPLLGPKTSSQWPPLPPMFHSL